MGNPGSPIREDTEHVAGASFPSPPSLSVDASLLVAGGGPSPLSTLALTLASLLPGSLLLPEGCELLPPSSLALPLVPLLPAGTELSPLSSVVLPVAPVFVSVELSPPSTLALSAAPQLLVSVELLPLSTLALPVVPLLRADD